MEQRTIGTVVRVEGERIWVATQRQSSCGGCAARGACGTGVLESLFSARNAPIELKAPAGVRTGDQVALVLSERALLKQGFWAYGVPLIGFFVGALLLQPAGELAALAGALTGLVGGWQAIRRWAPIEKPRVEKVIPIQGVVHEVE